MYRLGRLDLPARLAPAIPLWLGQILCAIGVIFLVALLRLGIDRYAPGAAPFLLLSPGVLLATLIAGWRAGVLALGGILYLAWRHLVLPATPDLSDPAHLLTVMFNAASGLLVILVAEAFRSLSQRALAERTAQLQQRDLLYRELDHRVKNTLAMITSIVQLERKRTSEPAAQDVLADLTARIDSIAHAHRDLYRGDDVRSIDLGAYLGDLCRHMGSALYGDARLRIECDVGHLRVDRDRALAFGLIINELTTNAAKHHAGIDAPVLVNIALARDGDDWLLTFADNGPGLPADYAERPGLGRRLIEAFAQQARAQLTTRNANGARFELRFQA